MRTSPPLMVDARDATTLRGWIEENPAGSAATRRARIVLLSAAGLGPSAVAEEVGCSKQTVITWRERYRADGLPGLRDAPRSGRPATVDAAAVITRTLSEPPERLSATRWSTRLLAAELGISNVAVANVWRRWGVTPGVAGQVRLATEPALDAPVAAVAGLHLDPPVRLLALLVTGSGPRVEPAVPVEQRPGLGTRLAAIDPGPLRPGGPAGLAIFLSRIAHLVRLDGPEPERLGLLVDLESEALRDWARARPGASVHVVPPELCWIRLVRVACVLAGASGRGAASVLELRRAVITHSAGQRFSWIAALDAH